MNCLSSSNPIYLSEISSSGFHISSIVGVYSYSLTLPQSRPRFPEKLTELIFTTSSNNESGLKAHSSIEIYVPIPLLPSPPSLPSEDLIPPFLFHLFHPSLLFLDCMNGFHVSLEMLFKLAFSF